MLKGIVFIGTAGVCVVMMATVAMAFGIGGYATFGGGNTLYDVNKYELASTRSYDSNNLAIGGGLIMDSNLAYDRVFNWRMKISGEQLIVDREAEMKLSRVHMSHTFGFGVVRTQMVRFWLGPAFGGSYAAGKRTSEKYYLAVVPLSYRWWNIVAPGIPYQPIGVGINRDKITKIAFGGIDLGFVLGLNINIGDFITIGPEAGFKYSFNWGAQTRKIYAGLLPTTIRGIVEVNLDNTIERLNLRGYEFYGAISVMFRFGGDNYSL
jgi:opacity protein-like surface antigen